MNVDNIYCASAYQKMARIFFRQGDFARASKCYRIARQYMGIE